MKPQKKGKAKSEKHHWWPECVSEHWKNADGKVHWLQPNGKLIVAPPKNFGCIGNGHYIKLARNAGETTPWDQNFEPFFDDADGGFPSVISWLKSLKRDDKREAKTLSDRFTPQNTSDKQIAQLVESIVSLAVRSPMQRQTGARTAEALRGIDRLPERERNTLITLNMRDSQQRVVSQIGTRGKFAILYSPKREFVFGDGFFHNIRSPVQPSQLNSYKMLVPITPEICVLYANPWQYITEPRLFTFVVTPEEADVLNNVVQIYSCNSIFYRSEMPKIISGYAEATHKIFTDSGNPVDTLISNIPGVGSSQSIFF
ncbi:DUF4238 domain-containing protein [Kiloniella laminariae]|uniref:DUF4238 domain-containing protein n=1 Tax=Kiloniella laminariae TaxID=454162 RepID=UPI00036326C9|nr:DUF4238 domain-containing protein [Kiloniella laminariae]